MTLASLRASSTRCPSLAAAARAASPWALNSAMARCQLLLTGRPLCPRSGVALRLPARSDTAISPARTTGRGARNRRGQAATA